MESITHSGPARLIESRSPSIWNPKHVARTAAPTRATAATQMIRKRMVEMPPTTVSSTDAADDIGQTVETPQSRVQQTRLATNRTVCTLGEGAVREHRGRRWPSTGRWTLRRSMSLDGEEDG